MKHHSTMIPKQVRDRLATVAGAESIGTVAVRILEAFKGRLLQEVIAGFPAMRGYTSETRWVRLALVLPEDLKHEVEAADDACPALQRMYLIGVLLATHADKLEALAAAAVQPKGEETDAARSPEVAVAQ